MASTTDKAVRLPITVKVTYSAGAYNTAAVLGQRASSTSSAETAAGRLVDKLITKIGLQPGTLAAKAVAAKGLKAGVSVWHINVAAGASEMCGGCGATLADRLQNNPGAPTGLKECPHCHADKCAMCDMGDDVECGLCELED